MGGGPEGSIGASWSWIVGLARLCGSGCLAGARPRPPPKISFSASTDGGGNLPRRRCLHFSSLPQSGSPMLILGRSAAYAAMRKRTILYFPRAAYLSPTGRDSRADRDRRRDSGEFPGQANALRPLCLRHRRQSGGGRTRRDRHLLGDRQGLHADGVADRHRRGRFDRAAYAATSSEGTLAELLVIAAAVIGGTSLQAASVPWPARCSAPC